MTQQTPNIITPKYFWETPAKELAELESTLRVARFKPLIEVSGTSGFTWMISWSDGQQEKCVWDHEGRSLPIDFCKTFEELEQMFADAAKGACFCLDCGKTLWPDVDHVNQFFAGYYCDSCFPKHRADRDWAYSHLD